MVTSRVVHGTCTELMWAPRGLCTALTRMSAGLCTELLLSDMVLVRCTFREPRAPLFDHTRGSCACLPAATRPLSISRGDRTEAMSYSHRPQTEPIRHLREAPHTDLAWTSHEPRTPFVSNSHGSRSGLRNMPCCVSSRTSDVASMLALTMAPLTCMPPICIHV